MSEVKIPIPDEIAETIELSGFDSGEAFGHRDEVRAYMQMANMRRMFGPEEAHKMTQARLDRATEWIILHGYWHVGADE